MLSLKGLHLSLCSINCLKYFESWINVTLQYCFQSIFSHLSFICANWRNIGWEKSLSSPGWEISPASETQIFCKGENEQVTSNYAWSHTFECTYESNIPSVNSKQEHSPDSFWFLQPPVIREMPDIWVMILNCPDFLSLFSTWLPISFLPPSAPTPVLSPLLLLHEAGNQYNTTRTQGLPGSKTNMEL